MGGVYTGKDAYINGVSCVTAWSVTEAVTAKRYSASCVPGATAVPEGIVNFTGQVSGVGAYPIAVIPTGTDLTFKGVVNNTGGSLLSLNGSILVEQLTIDIDATTREAIKWAATFGAQGALTEASTGAADSVVQEAETGKDFYIKVGASGLTQAVTKAQIVLRRPHATRVSGGATYRKAGNLEADLNFTVEESSLLVATYARNVKNRVKIFTYTDPMTSDQYCWEFNQVRFLGKSNFEVSRENPPKIISYQVNAQWHAVDGNGAELGYILYGIEDSAEAAPIFGGNPH